MLPEAVLISRQAEQVGPSNTIRFQGQYHDPEAKLHYNHNRDYDPKAGRFIN
ncbi:RHS repeat-associated core domain-containing protein [Pseudomonas oryziphila]|uniref:Uncharacterized protein n=1 Tax=Pseudomonas oryziphila TaxID=2894079 RepID=A0ABN5TBF6_9PSED|nr:hypothetical protein EI693_02770 [Pseudomonas oryziphila]